MGSSTSQQSSLVCWPGCFFGVLTTGHCTDLFACSHFSEKLVSLRVRKIDARGAAIRGEALGESWLPALLPLQLQQRGSVHSRMGEQEEGLSSGVQRKGNHGAKSLKKKLAYHCTGRRCPFFCPVPFPCLELCYETMLEVPGMHSL